MGLTPLIFCNKLASVLPTLPAAAKVASSRITWQVPQVPSPPQPSIENGDRRPLGSTGKSGKEEGEETYWEWQYRYPRKPEGWRPHPRARRQWRWPHRWGRQPWGGRWLRKHEDFQIRKKILMFLAKGAGLKARVAMGTSLARACMISL